jgi:transposase
LRTQRRPPGRPHARRPWRPHHRRRPRLLHFHPTHSPVIANETNPHYAETLGRRAKRFLSPSQKYEIWLQLLRQETSISEAADRFEVDRSTIMRIREVARQGALEALATSKPGVQPTRRDLELEAARAEAARLGEALKELAVKLLLVEGNRCWG